MTGSTHTTISNYCQLVNRKTVLKATYYICLHIIEPVLLEMAIIICDEKLEKVKLEGNFTYCFDACWDYRRYSHHCLDILINLLDNSVVSFDIAHHGDEEFRILDSTKKNAKCMERITLRSIIENSQLADINDLTFENDYGLFDENLIQEMLLIAQTYFDPNHYAKKKKKKEKKHKKIFIEKQNFEKNFQKELRTYIQI